MAAEKKATATKKDIAKALVAKEEVKKTEAVKTEAPKVEEKVEAPKKEAAPKKAAAPKKEAAPKKAAAPKKEAAPKKAAAKTESNKVVIQFAGKEWAAKDLLQSAQDVWTYDMGKKVEDFKNVELYVKPEDNTVYFVVGDEKGSFSM